MRTFADYRDHVGANPTKFFKSTLFQSEHLLLGLNCLEPGQEQQGKAESKKLKAEKAPRLPRHISGAFCSLLSAYSFPLLVGIAPAPGREA